MGYLNPGSAGLGGSRPWLWMVSFGRHQTRRWALEQAAAEPILRRAADATTAPGARS